MGLGHISPVSDGAKLWNDEMTMSAACATNNAGAESATDIAQGIRDPGERQVFLAKYFREQWYVAYTSANREKRVAEQLVVRAVEHFLPTYSSVRKWKDRRVTLELPLFPGYVFVRLALRDRLTVLRIPGLARLVGFDGTPTSLPDEEIEALRSTLKTGVRAEQHPFLKVGRRVRVRTGPMVGLQGVLKRRKNQSRLVVCVDLIQRAVALEIDERDLEALESVN
jgi:transcription antitermination factor NusG